MYQLPDSPDTRRLVEYLKQQIEECNELEYENEGTRTGEKYHAKKMAYRDILNKIKIV